MELEQDQDIDHTLAPVIDESDIIEEEDDSDDDISEIPPPVPRPTAANGANALIAANNFSALSQKLMKPIKGYPVKDEAHYVWEIENWSALTDDKVRSPTFECGGFKWNILLFPRGNNNSQMLSIYIEPHPIPGEDGNIDDDWYVYAQFGLDLWNPANPSSHLPSGSSCRFDKNQSDWGFASLVDPRELANSSYQRFRKPILENNRLNITAFVRVIDDSETGVLGHNFLDYDSKKYTGFVGLNNQGATCYLNSLLQSYFTTKNFRKLVYQIPGDKATGSVAFALQKIFYLLSTSNDPVSTMELTKSFGWDSSDAFTQHDVQELNRILMDKLEIAMKETEIEGRLNDVFVGKMKSYIKCVNVPYESSRVEDFWDIQLNVKGFRNLQESFENYIEIEMLDGENKYQAGDEYGYQDAKKGVVFESFPPVLHLQLKRFEYDFMVDDLVKIDDFYEFPDSIDLSPYLDADLPELVKNQNWNYKLHGVLVHQGTISNGHYYAMIKPNATKDGWLKFDDDKVLKVLKHQVFDENFGANEITQEEFSRMTRAEQQENLIRRVTSAYMLVYYRESDLEEILPEEESAITDVISKHIPEQINAEIEEHKRLEKAKQDALYYTYAKFIVSNTFSNFGGFDLALDAANAKLFDESLVNTAADPISMKVKKDDPFTQLYKSIGVKLGYFTEETTLKDIKSAVLSGDIPFRLFTTTHRMNLSQRAEKAVPNEMIDSSIIDVYYKLFNRKFNDMVYFVEEFNKELTLVNDSVSTSETISPKDFKFSQIVTKLESIKPTEEKKTEFNENTHSLLFLKYFDPILQQLRGLTHVVVRKDAQIKSLIPEINKFLLFDSSQKLDLFEELSHVKIEPIDQDLTFEKHELSTGDILTIQVADVSELAGKSKFTSVVDCYRFVLTRMHIQILPYRTDCENEYDDFVEHKEASEVISQIVEEHTPEKSFDLWVSTLYSYEEVAAEVAKEIGPNIDPSYLRLYFVNNGVRYPLKSNTPLSQSFLKTCHANQIYPFEYSVLKVKLSEFENLKSIRIHWLTSLLQYQTYEFLIARDGTVRDLISKLIHKLNIPEKEQKHILVWGGKNHKYKDLVRFERPIESIDESLDLYAGVFPAEVEILATHDLINRYDNQPVKLSDLEDDFKKEELMLATKLSKELNIIPAFHFYKNSSYHHGIPFLFPVYKNETFDILKERLRKKLGVGTQAFEKIRFALADSSDKGSYLDSANNDIVLYDEIGKLGSSVSLALDHPDRSPRRQNQFDKGISIK